MRGDHDQHSNMLLEITPDELIPTDQQIHKIKAIVEPAPTRLSPVFDQMYAKVRRASIRPEHLLKASLLIALYSVRSERQFCERLQYYLLSMWFLDMNISESAFDASSFSKSKEQLLQHEVAAQCFQEVLGEAKRGRLLSQDHFTVDSTLLEAWASTKSFRPRDPRDPPSDARG